MNFKKIDRSTWKREEYFKHFFSNTPCTYSMTVHLDITNLHKTNKKLYPTMIYLITTIVNKHEEFRTSFDNNDNIGIYEQILPCYTIFHKGSETFSNIWTEYSNDFNTFYENYQKDISQYGDIECMNAKPNIPENTFPISMVPWTSFSSFNLNLQKGYNYLLPIFTIGKYKFENNIYLLPISIQVHHAVCDGFHLSRFINELQDLINNFSLNY